MTARVPLPPEDILAHAANFTSSFVNRDDFDTAAQAALNVLASKIVARIDPLDRAGLFTALEVFADGKWQPGCLLGLEDRVVLGWWSGLVRIKLLTCEIPIAQVSDVAETDVEQLAGTAVEKVTLRIDGDVPMRIRVARYDTGMDLPEVVRGVLLGAISYGFEGDPEPETQPLVEPDGLAPEPDPAPEAVPVTVWDPAPAPAPPPVPAPVPVGDLAVCGSCGAALSPAGRFCRSCGAATGSAPASAPEPESSTIPAGVAAAVDQPPPRHADPLRRGGAIALVVVLAAFGIAFLVTRGGDDPPPRAERPAPTASPPSTAAETPVATPEAPPSTETDDLPALSERFGGAGFVAEMPSLADGWEIGDERDAEGLMIRELRGPEGALIRMVQTPGGEAEPDESLVVEELALKTAAAASRLVTLKDFPTEECAERICSDFLLNDPAWGGLAILVAAEPGEYLFRLADAIARTVRSEADADVDPQLLAPAPGSGSLPPGLDGG